MSEELIKEDSKQPQYVITGGVKQYTFPELDKARRLAEVLSEKISVVIKIQKEDSDEVYKYAHGKELL